jgi:outer membrane protein assembly factor BamB
MTILFLAQGALVSADWPQWRGPQRDGVSRGVPLPAQWPRELKKAWAEKVGAGYSSPVLVGNDLFVFSRQGSDEVVTKLDAASGRVAWRKSYAAAFQKNAYAKDMAPGPFATPLVAGGRVYTFGVTAVLSCWDAVDGRLVWRKDWSGKQDTSKLFTGTAMSPVIDSGLLIVFYGDDRAGTLAALDPATGREKWTTAADGPGYGSPVVFEAGGVRQFALFTTKSLIGVSVREGKLLWTVPYKDEYNENIVTPVVYRDLLIVSGVRHPAAAYRVQQAGGKWSAEMVWSNEAAPMYMASPVLVGDYLYGLSARNKGQWICLDARTGKTVWATKGREGMAGSVTLAGDRLVLLAETGSLVVAKASPAGFEQVTRYEVGEGTYGYPVLVPGGVIVKDAEAVTLWKW